MTKPRYVIIGLQTNRNHVIASHPDVFDHCNISNMQLYLNNERYPYNDMNLNFSEGDFCELYNVLRQIQDGYYGGTQPINPADTFKSFRREETIFYAFDCSRSDESVKRGMVDVRIEMVAQENFPANTAAYCLIIHDNMVRYCPSSGLVFRNI